MTTKKHSLKGANFLMFWLGQTASNFGDAFGFVALPLLVFEATRSVAHMGTVTAATALGQLAASPVAGSLVDRLHRRRLMVACDAARFALYLALPWACGLTSFALPAICSLAFAAGAASNLFTTAYTAAVSNLVDAEDIARANASLQGSQALAYVAGSLAAGYIAARYSPQTALVVDACTFGLSALSLARIQFLRESAPGDQAPAKGWKDIKEGLDFLLAQPTLRALTWFQASIGLLGSLGLGAAVIDLVVFRLKHDLGTGSDGVGVVLSLAAVGAVVGAVLAPKVEPTLGLGPACLAGTALQGVGLLLAGACPGVPFVALGCFFWAGGLTLRSVAQLSLRQQLTPDRILGRVTSASWTGIFVASSIGAILVTRVAQWWTAGWALAGVGILLGVVSVAGMATPLARKQGH